MDNDFKDFWLNYTIKEAKHWYNGASWYKDLPNMLYQYIVNYLNYFYVLPGPNQNELSNYILYELNIRRINILDKCQTKRVNFTNREFILLHKILRNFNTILLSKNYRIVETYILQLLEFFTRINF